jgi:hypothetical protein
MWLINTRAWLSTLGQVWRSYRRVGLFKLHGELTDELDSEAIEVERAMAGAPLVVVSEGRVRLEDVE